MRCPSVTPISLTNFSLTTSIIATLSLLLLSATQPVPGIIAHPLGVSNAKLLSWAKYEGMCMIPSHPEVNILDFPAA